MLTAMQTKFREEGTDLSRPCTSMAFSDDLVGAKVIATALQFYRKYLAKIGNAAVMLQSDINAQARWIGFLAASDLSAFELNDFKVLNSGIIVPLSTCERLPSSRSGALANGSAPLMKR